MTNDNIEDMYVCDNCGLRSYHANDFVNLDIEDHELFEKLENTKGWQDNYNYSDAIYTLCKFCYKDVKDNTDNNNRRINL